MKRFWVTVVSMSLVLASVLPSSAQDTAARADKIGSVRFPTSCSAAAQPSSSAGRPASFVLVRGGAEDVHQRHHDGSGVRDGLLGDRDERLLPALAAAQPGHAEKGRAALDKSRGLEDHAAREGLRRRDRQIYCKDSAKLDHRTRAVAYEKAMEQVTRDIRQDREASVFYALALNATAAADRQGLRQSAQGRRDPREGVRRAAQSSRRGARHHPQLRWQPPLATRGADRRAQLFRRSPRRSPTRTTCRRHLHPGGAAGRSRSIPTSLRPTPARPTDRAAAAARRGIGRCMPGLLVYGIPADGADSEARRIVEEVSAYRKAEPENFVARPTPSRRSGPPGARTPALDRGGGAHVPAMGFRGPVSARAEAIIAYAHASGSPAPAMPRGAAEVMTSSGSQRGCDALTHAKKRYWADQVEVQRRAAGRVRRRAPRAIATRR